MKKQPTAYTAEEQAIISAAASLWGRKGGQAGTGASKARPITSEQARHAVNVRWARYRAAKSSK
jgi:hypothetical protein